MSASSNRKRTRVETKIPGKARRNKTSSLANRGKQPRLRGGRPPAQLTQDLLVAAFEAGRAFNRLGFHLQQAWLDLQGQRRMAKEAADQFCLHLRSSVAVRTRTTVSQQARRMIRPLISRPEELDHAEQVQDALAVLNDGPSRYDGDHDQLREELLGGLFRGLGEVREAVGRRLDETGFLALELGEVMDQGLCRPDVHRYTYEPQPSPPPLGPGASPQGSSFGMPRDPKADWDPDILANTRRGPGEILPSDCWLAEVRQLWDELGMRESSWPRAAHVGRRVSSKRIKALVEALNSSTW